MRRADPLLAILTLIGLAVTVAYLAAPETQISGAVRVIDGDTIKLGGQSIRLAGMDAPELAQTCMLEARPQRCGEVARDALERIVAQGTVSCRIVGHDRYRRGLGRCDAGGGDIGARLVQDGLAVGYGDYAREEHEARIAGRGLWAGSFQRPATWRRAHRSPDRNEAESRLSW